MDIIEVQKLHLDRLQEKAGRLVAELAECKANLKKTKTENQALKEQLKVQQKQLEGFQYQEEISKIVSLVADGNEEKEELKTKIDTYIQEIDHCINFLNKAL